MTPIMAFTGQQVERLTGLSRRVLRYWEETDVFRASYVDDRPRVPYRRIYTFRDLVGLRTLALLRREHGVKLDDLRKTGQHLQQRYDAPWAELGFGVTANGRVVFREPGTGIWMTGHPPGQMVIPISVEEIAKAAERDAAKIAERRPEDVGKVDRHRHVLRNAWRLKGTRIPTSAIWHFHEDGYGTEAILRAYPDLTAEDVEAALAHERTARGLAAA